MNLETFRKNVEENEVYKEKIPLVRIAMENQYDLYEKYREINYKKEIEKENFNEKDFNFIWRAISLNHTTKLYNEMGWRNNLDKSKSIYDKIQEIENNIDFVYAMLFVTNFISKELKLYEYLAKDILQYLKEHELSELIKWTRIDNRKTVFVAMSFDESMQNARKKITEAVESFGYEAMLIDIKEHNNQIVPEIFTEIKKSKFVIADLTGQRGGVYFEAGYAKALEKDLILCCKKEEQEKVHFDVAQINTIFWEDENDLYKRLRKRIESTIETETYF